MRRFRIRLDGITISPSGLEVARIAYTDGFILQPGQAVLAYKPGDWQPLRKVLFPIQIYPDGFMADAAPESTWRIGDTLDTYGPLGKGFTPPASAKKWLLASFHSSPDKVLALIQPGLEGGAALALYAHRLPTNLPPQVEWVESLEEALAWADYLALDLPLNMLPSLRNRLGLSPGDQFPYSAQALINQALPCGIGACHACAIKSQQGWSLVCTEGPVFKLNQLEF
jgi:hypothetical protein